MLTTIKKCDITGEEIPDGTGLTIYLDKFRGSIDLSDVMCRQVTAWYITNIINGPALSVISFDRERIINMLKATI
jgi:hypothetical protein